MILPHVSAVGCAVPVAALACDDRRRDTPADATAAHEHAEAQRERLLLQAFLGYKLDLVNGRVLISCCMSCPGKPYVEVWAKRHGSVVSHGICATHAAEMIARVTGDRS